MASPPPGSQFHHVFKFLLCGDSGVGKSCLLLRFTDGVFQNLDSTIAVDFRTKSIVHSDLRIKLQIWDTAGQERFRVMLPAYYRGAMGAVLCFDLTKVETMHHLADWYKHIMDYAPEDIKLVICGTKCDMVDRREVSRAEAEEFAATLRCPYFETSSMTGEGVDKAFLELVRLSVEGEKGDKRSGADSKAAGSRVTVDDKNRGANGSGNKKKGCC